MREPKRAKRGTVVKRAEEPDPDPSPRSLATARSSAHLDSVDPDAGVFSGLVAPHPGSTSGEAAAQWALTTIASPLILSTLMTVGWFDSRRAWDEVVRQGGRAPRPVGIAHPVAWMVGAVPLVIVCLAQAIAWPITVAVVGIPFVALFGRRMLRRSIIDREAVLAMRRKRR